VKIPPGWKLTSDTSITTDDDGHYVLRFDLRISERYEAWRRGPRFLGNFATPEAAVQACEADRAEIKAATAA
jgi:hypothetical protein